MVVTNWLGRSTSAGHARPAALAAAPNTSLAPVRAVVTDGETGEVIANSTLTFTTIDVPGEGFTSVQSVNASGEMAGIYAENDISSPHGFSLSGGNFSFIDYPGAEATRAWGINDLGLIVGQAEFQNDTVELGFEYDGTTFTPISDGSATVCLGVNNAGWVVGGDGTVGFTHGFELRGRTFKPIVPPGNYVYIYATGINKFGQVVGYSDDDGFSYSDGKYETVDFPGSPITEPWGIHDSGMIVGLYAMNGYIYAFAMKKGKFISFSYPGAEVTAAYGINAYDQIVGAYSLDYEIYHGFITSPLTPADFPPDE